MIQLKRHLRARGLSLFEVLLATALAATLLTAVGIALTSMLNSIRENDTFTRGQQAGRVALNSITNRVRRSREVYLGPSATHPLIAGSASVNEITLLVPEYDAASDRYVDHIYRFYYDSAKQQLQLSKDDAPLVPVLGSNPSLKVSALQFTATTEEDLSDAAYPYKYRYVTISMTLVTNATSDRPDSLTFADTVFARSIRLGD